MVNWRALQSAAGLQDGLVTRTQCVAAGMTRASIRHRLQTGRWEELARQVYSTTPGRRGWEIDAMAAVMSLAGFGPAPLGQPIAAGTPPAALWGLAAARAWGIGPARVPPIVVAVPASRAPAHRESFGVRRIQQWDRRVDPVAVPWRTTQAATIVDCASLGSPDEAAAWLARGIRGRFVTGVALQTELDSRQRIRHGSLMREVLGDVVAGAHSAAEVRFARDVERAHGLPEGRRQVVSAANGYAVHDNEYIEWGVVIEVDGRLGHETWRDRVRDGARDRQLAATGRFTSRVFWVDVAVRPCATAREVAGLLAARGWQGHPHPCRRSDCALRAAPGLRSPLR